MKRGVPLNSAEARRLVERGPAWREHPDYYAPEPPDEDIPWHTEKDVDLAVARMTNWAQAQTTTVRLLWDLLAEDEWRSLARVGLGMKP